MNYPAHVLGPVHNCSVRGLANYLFCKVLTCYYYYCFFSAALNHIRYIYLRYDCWLCSFRFVSGGVVCDSAQFAVLYTELLQMWGDRAKVELPLDASTVFSSLDLYGESKLTVDDVTRWAVLSGLLD